MPANDTTPAGANPQVTVANPASSDVEAAGHAYDTLLAVVTGVAAEHGADLPEEAPPQDTPAATAAPEQAAPDGSTTWVSIGLLAGDTCSTTITPPHRRQLHLPILRPAGT